AGIADESESQRAHQGCRLPWNRAIVWIDAEAAALEGDTQLFERLRSERGDGEGRQSMRPCDADFAQRLLTVRVCHMDGSVLSLCCVHGFRKTDHLTVQHTWCATGRHADDEHRAADARSPAMVRSAGHRSSLPIVYAIRSSAAPNPSILVSNTRSRLERTGYCRRHGAMPESAHAQPRHAAPYAPGHVPLAAFDVCVGPGLQDRGAPPSLCPIAYDAARITPGTRRAGQSVEEGWCSMGGAGCHPWGGFARPHPTDRVLQRGERRRCCALRAHRRRDCLCTRTPSGKVACRAWAYTERSARRTLADEISYPPKGGGCDPSRGPACAETPSGATDRTRRSVPENVGGHRGLVAFALHACVYGVGRRPGTTLHSLAPAPAGSL